MDVKDYSQKLTDERQKFQDQIQNSRQNYKDEIDRLEKKHADQREDLASKYNSSADKTRKEANDTIELNSKSAGEALAKKENELLAKNRAEKNEFERQNTGLREEMNNRLGQLKDSYEKTLIDSNKTNMGKLADQKQRFGDQASELRHFYDESLKNQQSMHDQKASDLAKNYRGNLARLEEDTSDTLAERSKVTKESVNKLKEDQSKKLANVREEFNKERDATRKDFNLKLGSAQDSYRDAVAENQRQGKTTLNNAEASFERRLKGKDQEIDGIVQNQKKNEGKIADYMSKENERSRDVNVAHQKEKNQLISQGLQDRDTTVKKLQSQTAEAQKAYNSEMELMKEFNDQTKRLARKDGDERLQNTDKKYQNVINDMSEKDRLRSRRLADEQTLQLDEVKRGFDDDRKDFRHKLSEMSDNSNYRQELQIAENGRLKEQFERAMKDKKVQLDEDRFDRQVAERSSSNDFQNLLKEKDLKRTMSGQRREKEFHDFMLEKETAFNREKVAATDNFEKQVRTLTEDNVRQSKVETDSFKRVMDNQSAEFAKTTKTLEEKGLDNLNDLQRTYAKEKTDFIEKTRRDIYQASLDQKDLHRKNVDATTESYEKRLTGKDKELQRLQELYENKLAVFQKNSNEEIQALKRNHAQGMESEKRASKDLLFAREKEYTKRLESMRKDFEMAMAKMASSNDVKVTKMTQRYEDMIARVQSEHKAEMEIVTRQNKEEYEKLANASVERFETMKDQYELKIEKLRLANVNEDAKAEIRKQEAFKAKA